MKDQIAAIRALIAHVRLLLMRNGGGLERSHKAQPDMIFVTGAPVKFNHRKEQ